MDDLKAIETAINILKDVRVKNNTDANACIMTAIDVLIGAQCAIQEQSPPRPMATRNRRRIRKRSESLRPTLY